MNLITKNKAAFLLFGVLLAVCVDANAVPFFAKQNRNTLAQSQADAGGSGQNALMTGFTQDVQGGLSDFQFLARNFSGSNSGTGRPPISTTGLIGAAPATNGGVVVPAPLPGSLSLLSLGASLLFWRRRK
jgi:hypothetical protein